MSEAGRLADELDAYGAAFDDGPGVFAEAAALLRAQATALAEREGLRAGVYALRCEAAAAFEQSTSPGYKLHDVYRAKLDILLAAAPPPNKPEPIRCPEKLKPGGCQLHNLHCGWPACNKEK